MIVNAQGQVLVRKAERDGEGVITGSVEVPAKPQPREAIPDRFWIPLLMPDDWQQSWQRWVAKGEDNYKMVTLPFLARGKINEYIPESLR